MATQRIERTTELVSTSALSFIRPIVLRAECTDLRPNTRMYAFFGGVSIDHICRKDGGDIGDALITDADGQLRFSIHVPGRTFNTGNIDIIIKESPVFSTVVGSTDVFAKAKFSSSGILQRFQTTVNTTNISVQEVVEQIETVRIVEVDVRRDPLAQSFFTHGVKGGCFVTSIVLYFNTVDTELPVWVELRGMTAGMPNNELVQPWARKSITAAEISDIIYTQTAPVSIPVKFTFDKPVYLKEDGDFCFVVQSRSSKYTVWTSKLGERSIETGKIVFDQPYNGSLFKSENNFTWTPEQNEDIKFKLNIAKFVQPNSQLNLALAANVVSISCTSFSTTQGSNRITVRFPFKHSLLVNDKIRVATSTEGTYNGIPSSDIHGIDLTVKVIVDDFSVSFDTNGTTLATKTGKVLTGGKITSVSIIGNAKNMVFNQAPTITNNGDTVGQCILGNDNRIVGVSVNPSTTVYTSEPVVMVADGAIVLPNSALASIDEKFYVTLNREYHSINPLIPSIVPPGTQVDATLYSTDKNTLVSPGSIATSIEINKLNAIPHDSTLFSVSNDNLRFGGVTSTRIGLNFKQSGEFNENVSPMLDISSSSVMLATNSINSDTEIGTSETTPDTDPSVSKLAQSRYVSKKQQLETTTTAARVFVTAYSNSRSNFHVYIRTSKSSGSITHENYPWVPLECIANPDSRNLSSVSGEFVEYEFSLEDIEEFDVFSLKFILSTTTRYDPPIIKDYRAIMIA
jgi:hypothetical protein